VAVLFFCGLFGALGEHRYVYAQTGDQTPLGNLQASAGSPIYTVYAAPLDRTQYIVDQGYRLVFDRTDQPLGWETDTAGTLELAWKDPDGNLIENVADYVQTPTLIRSYSDCGELRFSPMEGIEASLSFAVYSSRFLALEVRLLNKVEGRRGVSMMVRYRNPQGISDVDAPPVKDHFFFRHSEPPEKLSETKSGLFPKALENVVLSRPGFDSQELILGPEQDEDKKKKRGKKPGGRKSFGFVGHAQLTVSSKRERVIRLVRGVDISQRLNIWLEGENLINDLDFPAIFEEAEQRLSGVPRLTFEDSTDELIYWQSFSLVRQMMMPPEGVASFNYYVFSREPTWGWGHDGQVFHESLAMLTHVYADPKSVMDSQRLFMEHQLQDGYIYYRLGPYAAREFKVKGERTTSAPFFNWLNWEIYQVSSDKEFLAESFASGARYVEYLLSTRDKDHDGLFEWGGNAVLECVRDGFNVIWGLLGDKPESPRAVEALDLNCMLVKEMKSLALMAEHLGKTTESAEWSSRASKLAGRINEAMWDEDSGFYYHVDKKSNRFLTEEGVDLRRMEIIGLLPLWAGIAPRDRAGRLLVHLKNPDKFWRRFGIPTLAADDPYFDPNVDRCCKWNGPVWLQWNYLVFRGLIDSGYEDEGREVAKRSFAAAGEQLKRNHLFWESYSPDNTELDTYAPYIWAGILARMKIDLAKIGGSFE
jgi:hypothetical protein